MIRKAILIAAVLSLAGALYAQETAKKSAKVTGFLIDNMCATTSDADAKKHEVSCALMPECEKSGFAVVSKDAVYKLDDAGNKRALEILKTTKTRKGLAVEVQGTLVGEVLQVDSIAEVY